jgi:hypothetical protein
MAAAERADVIVETFRLRRIDARRRRPRLDGERDAGGEPAARRIDDHAVGRVAEARHVFGDLAAGRALPGNNERVVVGWHQHGTSLLRDAARNRLAVLALAIVEHDLGAERRGALAFRSRRIARHHDDGRHVEQLRGRRDALRMIAGRKRHHPAAPLVGGERGQLVVGAAELERAGPLQRLRLEEDTPAGERIERRRGDQRGAQGDTRKPLGGGIHIGRRRQPKRRILGICHERRVPPPGPLAQGATCRHPWGGVSVGEASLVTGGSVTIVPVPPPLSWPRLKLAAV